MKTKSGWWRSSPAQASQGVSNAGWNDKEDSRAFRLKLCFGVMAAVGVRDADNHGASEKAAISKPSS